MANNGFYYINAFATSGDQTSVPTTGTEVGTVNFLYGYGSNYSASIKTDPSALLVDRLTFNYLLNKDTANWQALYQNGVVPFITSAMNGGSPYSYAADAMCQGLDGNIYFNTVANNTAIPGTANSGWFLWNPSWMARKGNLPLVGVVGGTYSFASLGTGCTLTYTVSGGVINAVSAVASGGTGYAVGDLITPNDGNYDAVIRVATVSGSAIATVTILYGGTGMAGGTAVATQKSFAHFGKITLTGVLASNATFIVPNGSPLTAARSWIVGNNTTGAFTVTFKVSNGSDVGTGTGIVIPQGSSNSKALIIDTDGATDVWQSNIFTNTFLPIPQNTVTSTPGSSTTNTATVANGGSLVQIPLPATTTDGDEFQVIGVGAGGWKLTQAAGQQIIFGTTSTTIGVTGSLASTNRYNSVKIKYSTAATAFMVTASIGNLTVV